jgi:hypothetical protein
MTSRPADLVSRARGEFLEMPGLSLTLTQAQRLWALDEPTCSSVLGALVRSGFLHQRQDGSFVRSVNQERRRIAS